MIVIAMKIGTAVVAGFKPASGLDHGRPIVFIPLCGLHKAIVIPSEAEESTVCDAKPPGAVDIWQAASDSRRPGIGVRLSDQNIRPEVMD